MRESPDGADIVPGAMHADADAATRLRITTVVESMGAAAAGAHELLMTKEP